MFACILTTVIQYMQINAFTAMKALRIGAPKDYMQLLEDHADMVNLPRVGVDENVAFPAVQANIAPAVALQEATSNQNQPCLPIKSLLIFFTL